MPVVKEFFYPSADGHNLIYAKMRIPDVQPHAVLQIIHGMDEHIGRYDDFADYMAQNGYVVVGEDHLGHGRTAKTEDDFGFFASSDGWSLVLSDIHALHEQTAKQYPDLPYFILGHSMGSFLLRSYIIRYPGQQFGAIICATAQMPRHLVLTGIALAKSEIKAKGERYRSAKLHALSFGAYNKQFEPVRTQKDWLSRDTAVVDANLADPYCNHMCTASMFRDMLGGILSNRKLANLAQMDHHLRVLFIAGEKDPVGDCGRGVRAAYNSFVKAGMNHVRMKLFADARHEILNETNRREVYEYIYSWAEQRMENKRKAKAKIQ